MSRHFIIYLILRMSILHNRIQLINNMNIMGLLSLGMLQEMMSVITMEVAGGDKGECFLCCR
jgi:hypothetical protein